MISWTTLPLSSLSIRPASRKAQMVLDRLELPDPDARERVELPVSAEEPGVIREASPSQENTRPRCLRHNLGSPPSHSADHLADHLPRVSVTPQATSGPPRVWLPRARPARESNPKPADVACVHSLMRRKTSYHRRTNRRAHANSPSFYLYTSVKQSLRAHEASINRWEPFHPPRYVSRKATIFG